jgi:hypothetical protein
MLFPEIKYRDYCEAFASDGSLGMLKTMNFRYFSACPGHMLAHSPREIANYQGNST